MTIATYTSVQREISNLIKRFRFEELESPIIHTFPELSWTSIRSDLVKHRQTFTSANVAQLILSAITKQLQIKDLKDRLSTLQLIDISYHSKRKTWYGYTLLGSVKADNPFTNREIQNNMQQYFDSLNIKVDVKVNIHCGIAYVSLTKKQSTKKKSHSRTPTFFAFFIGQKYLFCDKRNVEPGLLKAVTRSIGYEHSKSLKLSGKDLESLSRLCWNKKKGTIDSQVLNEPLKYTNAAPDIKNSGIDFTQWKQKKEFAERCFGNNSPTLELFVINGASQPFLHSEVATKLSNESICVSWEFRSHNISTYLTKLIERRILVTPVPYYISNLMMLGKNEITLRGDKRF